MVYTCKKRSFSSFEFLLGILWVYRPGNKIVYHRMILLLIIWRLSILVFQNDHRLLHSHLWHAHMWILSNLGVLAIFYFLSSTLFHRSHPIGCEVASWFISLPINVPQSDLCTMAPSMTILNRCNGMELFLTHSCKNINDKL